MDSHGKNDLSANAPSSNTEIIKTALGEDVNLTKHQHVALSKFIDVVSKTDDALTVLELVPRAAAILSSSAFMRYFVSGVSITSIILFPVDATLKLIKANRMGVILYGYRAAAYSVTAWAFGHNIPRKSEAILNNAALLYPKHPTLKELRKSYDDAWDSSAKYAIKKIESRCHKEGYSVRVAKLLLKALSDEDPKKLALSILQGFEQELAGNVKHIYKSNYSVKYPR